VAYIHPDQSTFGGIHQTRLAAIWAHTQGVRTAIHMSESPLSLICCAHIAAGIPDFLACEHHYLDDVSWYDTLFDGIEKPIVEKSTGCVLVPEGPGLGITPNAAAITARLASGGYFTQ
jgi:L-alanine-DL-glutamate epimerase-like enolase superfamily enzyme